MIKEHNLINLGFTKNEMQEWDTGGDPTYYFTLELGHPQHGLCLITNCESNIEKDESWYVEFFDTGGFKRITDLNELMDLIAILKKLEQ